ncbi:VOC family protein [Proteiniclasticum sp.]|uniref:VOC family protein n=1 Tax=Proteiniclasticum sp. TaxID=2053595 RepID=UPI00289B2034|nr:VOC family protein [Proteiniclasticum sp.]
MKFIWSTLKVGNMNESIVFYENILGLKTVQRFQAGPDMEIAFLGEGETQIELIQEKNREKVEIGHDISWGFQVDSLKVMMDVLEENGISVHSGPFMPNPFTRFIYILDPDGMKIQLVEKNNPKENV